VSKLFDQLKNAARLRSRRTNPDVPSAILALALRRAEYEREQARAGNGAARAEPVDIPAALPPSFPPPANDAPEEPDEQRRRLKRRLTLVLTALLVLSAVIGVRTFVPGATSAEHVPLPVFKLDRELKSAPAAPDK